MIRYTLMWLCIFGLSVYAWRDWYVSLCGLVLLMAFVEHRDMPTQMYGIPGLNPWNLLFCVTLLAWAVSRRREGLVWDMSGPMAFLLLAYFGVIIIGTLRMLTDQQGIEGYTTSYLVNEHFFNTLKWTVPGLLLFDGCRSRKRFLLGLVAILGLYFLLALQVIKWMPLDSIMESGDVLQQRAVRVLDREIGYHRVDLSMMLAGASWAVFASRLLLKQKILIFCAVGVSGVIAFGQALTAGRMGYITWAIIGTILCLLRWRKYIWLAPFAAACIALTVPSIVERTLEGFGEEQIDEHAVTSGRTVAWSYVIAKINEAPIFGFGRLGMLRTGIVSTLAEEGEAFGHPHNAYLEMTLDNGFVGLGMVLPFYLTILYQGLSLFRDSRSPIFVATGGVVCSFVLAQLIASMGAQSFYPRAGVVGMWCAIGLFLRVALERSYALAVIQESALDVGQVPRAGAKNLRRQVAQVRQEPALALGQAPRTRAKNLRRPVSEDSLATRSERRGRTSLKRREEPVHSSDMIDGILWRAPHQAGHDSIPG